MCHFHLEVPPAALHSVTSVVRGRAHPAGRALTSDLFIHPTGRTLTSGWFIHPAGRAFTSSFGSYIRQEEYSLLTDRQ